MSKGDDMRNMSDMSKPQNSLSVGQLKKAKPENLIRLAKALKLNVEGMSHIQIARLIHWRVTRPDMNVRHSRFDTPEKRTEYESLWEEL